MYKVTYRVINALNDVYVAYYYEPAKPYDSHAPYYGAGDHHEVLLFIRTLVGIYPSIEFKTCEYVSDV